MRKVKLEKKWGKRTNPVANAPSINLHYHKILNVIPVELPYLWKHLKAD